MHDALAALRCTAMITEGHPCQASLFRHVREAGAGAKTNLMVTWACHAQGPFAQHKEDLHGQLSGSARHLSGQVAVLIVLNSPKVPVAVQCAAGHGGDGLRYRP